MKLLIDGDILIYNICAATEYVARLDDDLDCAFGNVREALALTESKVNEWANRFNATDLVFGFTGSDNFRKEIYPDYKIHRKSCRKPCGYKAVRELLSSLYRVVMEPRLEGDDVIGLLQCPNDFEKTMIISSDKDLNCIPGLVWNPDKDDEPRCLTVQEADRNWLMQTLTGDKTDGYPGLEGVGPVKADKILKEGTYAEVVEAYRNAGFNDEFALSQARCARILRHGEYDWATKEIKLWNP
jgi:DNA polymerase-1